MLPRAIATREAFENAMTLDIAMGGSTNTVLHLLAAAQEAEVDFTMADIDELSRRVPCVCKVAPNGDYLVEDVHRAGGIPAILGELRRGGLLNEDVRTVHADSIDEWLGALGHPRRRRLRRGGRALPRRARLRALRDRLLAVGALGVARPRRRRGLHPRRRPRLLDRRRPGDPLRQPRRARLRGEDGRRRRVDPHLQRPGRRARVPGGGGRGDPRRPDRGGRRGRDPLRGSEGRPRHAGDALPDLLPEGPRARRQCALLTDGRFCGGTSGLSIGHVSPEAASGGAIALVEDGDTIAIDIPNRAIELEVSDAVLERAPRARSRPAAATRRPRERVVSPALRAYAAMATSADTGAVRDVDAVERAVAEAAQRVAPAHELSRRRGRPGHQRRRGRRRASAADIGRQVLTGEGGAGGDEVGGCSLKDDPAAVMAGAGAEVDDPVGVRHDALVVLDDDQ